MAGVERNLGPAAGRGPIPATHAPRLPHSPKALAESQPGLGSLRFQALAGGRSQGVPFVAKRSKRDIALLFLEIAALTVLVAIVIYGALQLRDLNQESRRLQQAQLQSTAAVTTPIATQPASTRPIVVAAATSLSEEITPPVTSEPTAVPTSTEAPAALPTMLATEPAVLPSGHEPQEATAMPTVVQTPANTATSTPIPADVDPKLPLRLVIESLGIDAPVVEGDDVNALRQGIGHRLGTANPGEASNMVLSAHNDIYGEVFRDLFKLAPGDEVTVHTAVASYRYIVRSVEIVLPTRIEVMEPTDNAVLTMITCYPYLLDTHRVVAVADLAE